MIRGGAVIGEGQLDDLVDDIEEASSSRPTNPVKSEIEQTTRRVFGSEVLPATRRRASQHVGEYASQIRDVSDGWADDTYRHGLDTDSVVVRSHEHGTGRYNVDGRGTINASSTDGDPGYRISGGDVGGPLSFEVNGQRVTVDYVVHPGVKPKQFMSQTVDDYEERLADSVEEAVFDGIDRAFE